MSSSLRSVMATYDITVQSKTLVLDVNRVSDGQDDAEEILSVLVEKIVDIQPIELRTSYLSVAWVGEPGEGPGPIREFFGSFLPRTVFTNAKMTPPFADADPVLHQIGGMALFETTGSGDFFWPSASILSEGDRWLPSGTNQVKKYLRKIPGMKSSSGPFVRMQRYYDEKSRCALWCHDKVPGPSAQMLLGHVAHRNMWYECCGRAIGLGIMSRSTLGLRLPALFFHVVQKMMAETAEFTQIIKPIEWSMLEETDVDFYTNLKLILGHDFKKDGGLDMFFTFTDVTRINSNFETESEEFTATVRSRSSNEEKSQAKSASGESGGSGGGRVTTTTKQRLKTYTEDRPLVVDGDKKEINDDNKKEFVDLFATSHIMNHRYDAFRWLCEGMLSVLPATFYLKFTPAQLQSLICSKEEINVVEWKSACQYEMSGEADAILSSSQQTEWFWQWVEEGTADRHRALLEFWSGSRYPPVFGFKQLDGDEDELNGFKIHRARERKKDSLPTAATCDRRLELPTYKSYATLARAMEIATSWGSNGYTEV
jgi:hypothetical protein